MAKAIAATPTLSGKAADRFVQNLDKPVTEEKKRFLRQSKKVYKVIKENSKL